MSGDMEWLESLNNAIEFGRGVILMKQKIIIILAVSLFCVSCGAENTAGLQSGDVRGTNRAIETDVLDSAVRGLTEEQGKKEHGYEVEIKKYGFTLPRLETFQEELENLIYWTSAAAPTKEENNIYNYLKGKKALGKDLKVKLSYVRSETGYFDELDEEGRPSYLIYVCFPELQEKEQYLWLCSYNARGICDAYEFDAGETISKKELQEGEGEYKDWGETTIYIGEERAENDKPDKDASELRNQIGRDCLREIKELYNDNGEYEIYLYDFLPGDEWIKGRILNCDPKGGFIPVNWISVHVCYKGKKMEKYNGISWYSKPSGVGSDTITSKDAHDIIKPYREEMLPEHCFMAYRVRGKQITSLKQE